MPELGAIPQSTDPSVDIEWYYNVSRTVGPSKPNQKLDVKLVQWMLKKIVDYPSTSTFRPSLRPIQIDGFWGPTTAGYVRWFQRTFVYNMLYDGIVDKGKGDQSTISHTTYTIVGLNQTVWDFYGGSFLASPWSDADLPSDLMTSMRVVSANALLMFLDTD